MHLQTQGELQRTDQPLDLALDGDGLLLVRDKSGALGGTRTGAFHLTQEGRLQDAKDLTLQGWPLLPEGAGSTASATRSAAGVGAGASNPGNLGGTPFGSIPTGTSPTGFGTTGTTSVDTGSASIEIGTSGTRALGSGTTGAVPPPPSSAFIGPLGALEDIQLIKPGSAPLPEAPASPLLEEPALPPVEPPPFYGTGFSTQKEADGLYSLHLSAIYESNSYEGITIQRSFVDSLGRERTATGSMQSTSGLVFDLQFDDLGSSVRYRRYFDDRPDYVSNCIFDKTTKQMVVTFPDTGATLTFDWNDVEATKEEGYGDYPRATPEGTLLWAMPSMVFEEGTSKIAQELFFGMGEWDNFVANLVVERREDGSLVGHLLREFYGFEVELYFNEEGQVSSYQFTKSGNSTDDPSVGVKQSGAVVKGVHFVGGHDGTDLGTIDIDLGFFRAVDTTTPPKEEAIIPEEIKAGFAPLSPSSLSIDEHGVLRRLQDNGDWEPVYLLACAQFAAMNAAEERNGVYYATPASGVLQTRVSGQDGMGTITSGTLERSTTDLAHELSEMIRAQHAYAANTKVLSTIEDMLEELERL